MTEQKKKIGAKKWVVLALFIAAAILSAVFMGKVAINYNLADYLGKDTQTKIALDIIDGEFGMTGSLQVMAKNVSTETAEEIEYIPAENAWVPIEADGYLYINCLWVSGSMKGHGYSTDLLDECIRDAKSHGKKGLCILCAEGRKREFLADPGFLAYKGFLLADTSDCGITLLYLPLAEGVEPPRFKDCAKHPKTDGEGFVLYYTDQCPYTYYWVPRVEQAAKEHGISLKTVHITTKEAAQNVAAPVTTYALFRDGKFVTQSIQSDKKFLSLAGVEV